MRRWLMDHVLEMAALLVTIFGGRGVSDFWAVIVLMFTEHTAPAIFVTALAAAVGALVACWAMRAWARREIADRQRRLDAAYASMAQTVDVMRNANDAMSRSVSVGAEATRHIADQDRLIEKMYEIITRMTRDMFMMLSPAEKDAMEHLYAEGAGGRIGNEDVAAHLMKLNAIDRLPSGRYAVSGEWRRAMTASWETYTDRVLPSGASASRGEGVSA